MDEFPENLKYHKEHMWIREDGTIGISYFAQDQLGEVVFVEVPDAGSMMKAGPLSNMARLVLDNCDNDDAMPIRLRYRGHQRKFGSAIESPPFRQ